MEDKNGWEWFREELGRSILPIYKMHEEDFDFFGYHGRRHVSRSLILAEIMSGFYSEQTNRRLDKYGIRVAISFHDSGRQGNGKDIWENESYQLCYKYLLDQGNAPDYSDKVAQTILKGRDEVTDIESQIVYDSDVLEIMRFFTNAENGLKKFRASELLFLSHKDVYNQRQEDWCSGTRNKFIKEVWQFICETEGLGSVANDDYLSRYVEIIKENDGKYNTLNSWLTHGEVGNTSV